jgi:hypothetical protein
VFNYIPSNLKKNMKVKATSNMASPEGRINKGQIIEVTEREGLGMIKTGHAVSVIEDEKEVAVDTTVVEKRVKKKK